MLMYVPREVREERIFMIMTGLTVVGGLRKVAASVGL